MPLVYIGNPKHKEPWQPGRRGSLCPKLDIDPKELLNASEEHGGKRYATHGGRPFAAQQSSDGSWHGYPVGWREVPETIRRRWRQEGSVSRTQIKVFWEGVDE